MAAVKATTEEMVAGVRAHAYKHYSKGWDIIIECYTNEEIIAEIGGSKTVAGAVAKFGAIVRLRREMESNCW